MNNVTGGILSALAAVAAVAAPIDPMPENAIDTTMNWPAWLGPDGTNAATPSGRELVTDLHDARLVWTSEEIPSGRAPDGSDGCTSRMSGGQSSPVVAGGRVYLYYYSPSGNAYDRELTEQCGEMQKWLIDADDVIICLDAQTGETLWKRVYEQKGLNYNRFNKGMPALTPAVANGRVYAVGTGARAYCMNAENGEPLWDKTLGKRYRDQEILRAQMHASEMLCSFNRDMLAPAGLVIDDVFIANDHARWKTTNCESDYSQQHGVIALDARTGDSLWALPEGGKISKWTTGDTEYAVTTGGLFYDGDRWVQTARCMEPRTGETIWTVDCGGPAVIGDGYLVGTRDFYDKRFTCYRVNESGAVKAWEELQPIAEHVYPAIYRGYLYARLGSGATICYDLETGEEQGDAHYLTGAMGFIVAADGRIISNRDESHGGGQLQMYNADPDAFAPLGSRWYIDAAGGYDISIMPAIADGRMFVRMENAIACYDLRKDGSSMNRRAIRAHSRADITIQYGSTKPHVTLALPRAAHVEASIVDMRGRRIASLYEGAWPGGGKTIRAAAALPAGAAMISLRIDGGAVRSRMIMTP
jgi:outer membrane protein assembly factor BamB